MKSKYDHIVVGSGISGLTATLLLALNGRSVLLVEKAPQIGGSMVRFKLKGVPFDTGFHFTGGFSEGGLLDDMLRVLGLRDAIHPVFLDPKQACRFIFEDQGHSYEFPCGEKRIIQKLIQDFPEETQGVEGYFEVLNRVRTQTASMDIRHLNGVPEALDEDFITLKDGLDSLTDNERLKAILSGFAMCYGTPPSEVSFAAHCRMCHGLYESVARVDGGGQVFVDAFKEAFSALHVDVVCGTEIEEWIDLKERTVGSVRLSSGETIQFDRGLLTIHPKEILRILPPERISRGFVHRVEDYEASCGFFTLFATCSEDHMVDQITSLFPSTDVETMLDAESDEESAIVIMRSCEQVNGKPVNTLIAFEPCFEKKMAAWTNSSLRNRPADYEAWKAKKTERVCERIFAAFPELRETLTVLDSATPLTFRDYLHSPEGSAYGIKQKVGQFNLAGRLPWRNLFAAGQSAILPGVVGAMISSFITVRSLMGRDDLNTFIHERLGE